MNKLDKFIPKDTTKWIKKIADYYIESSSDDPRDFKNMQENYKLLTAELDLKRLNRTFNPMELEQADIDMITQDEIIPVILPSINTLIGESFDRNIDFRAYIMNPDAISEKEETIMKEYNARLQSLIEAKGLSDEALQLELLKIKQWKDYEAQDIRERFANHVLKDYMSRLNFMNRTKDGWKDLISNSQEIYGFTMVKGNVDMQRLHPTEVKLFGLPSSGNIQESEAIIYERYMTYTEIIANYELTKKEIDKLITKDGDLNNAESSVVVFSKEPIFDTDGTLVLDIANNTIYDKDEFSGRDGDKILVRTVYFKALRKIGTLHFINEQTGVEEIMTVDGEYISDEDMGEYIDWDYVPEYWQVTKLLEDIYVDMKACDVQMRDMNNPKLVYAPIVGKILKTGNRMAKSVLDTLKPLQYQWTAFNKKVMLLWSRNYGKLVRLDISKIPKKYGFDLNLFMSYIKSFGMIVEDPFNEGTKGQASGQFQSSVSAVDLELSSSIQQALQYMIYLRELADEIVGVNRQRRGELMASDGLGATQEAVTRSSKITEEIFQEHHEIQQTLLYYIVEYAKHSMINGENKKMQYITDDMITHMYEIDSSLFKDTDYGIFINNTRKQFQLEQTFMQLAHAYAQNGLIKMSDVMDLYQSNSISDKVNKLKVAEKERELREQEMEKQKQESQTQMQQMQMELRQQEMQHELALQQLKNEGIVQVAMIQAGSKIESDSMKVEQQKDAIQTNKEIQNQKNIYDYNKSKQQTLNKK